MWFIHKKSMYNSTKTQKREIAENPGGFQRLEKTSEVVNA
jgi:hypothetical protein